MIVEQNSIELRLILGDLGSMTKLGITQILKIFSERATRPCELPDREEERFFDPLSHPVLKAMKPRELADIPFPRPGPKAIRHEAAEDAHGR